jgi:hypothetical protein
MKNAIGDGTKNLCFTPGWVSLTETGGHEITHRTIHVDRLFETSLWCHFPIDGDLAGVSIALVITERRHTPKVNTGGLPARLG